jgi:hypothetical protein
MYRGAGFELSLPPGSRVGIGGAAGDTLVGPPVTEPGRSDELGGPGPHPTFRIAVATYPTSPVRPLAEWVDSVRRARNAVLDTELAQLAPAKPDSVAAAPALRALRLEPFCGDCDAVELYVGRGGQVVALAYELGIDLTGTRAEQERAHRRVLRTFRWVP